MRPARGKCLQLPGPMDQNHRDNFRNAVIQDRWPQSTGPPYVRDANSHPPERII
jgi:hypothetical protein